MGRPTCILTLSLTANLTKHAPKISKWGKANDMTIHWKAHSVLLDIILCLNNMAKMYPRLQT
jgi:hypothetical protein